MSNLIYGYVAYGIILAENDDCCVPDHLMRFRTDTLSWGEGLLQYLYPEGVPEGLETVEHYIRGHQRAKFRGQWEVPLLVIKTHYGITSSADSPGNCSDVVDAWRSEGQHWDELIAEFVRRCQSAGIEVYETMPHFVLYLSWDDSPTT